MHSLNRCLESNELPVLGFALNLSSFCFCSARSISNRVPPQALWHAQWSFISKFTFRPQILFLYLVIYFFISVYFLMAFKSLSRTDSTTRSCAMVRVNWLKGSIQYIMAQWTKLQYFRICISKCIKPEHFQTDIANKTAARGTRLHVSCRWGESWAFHKNLCICSCTPSIKIGEKNVVSGFVMRLLACILFNEINWWRNEPITSSRWTSVT